MSIQHQESAPADSISSQHKQSTFMLISNIYAYATFMLISSQHQQTAPSTSEVSTINKHEHQQSISLTCKICQHKQSAVSTISIISSHKKPASADCSEDMIYDISWMVYFRNNTWSLMKDSQELSYYGLAITELTLTFI